MFVTRSEQRAGLLVAVVSGRRPSLDNRPTSKLLEPLVKAGFPVVWVLTTDDFPGYESDGNPAITYSPEWELEYARKHWVGTKLPEMGGYIGPFPGREWACLEAERRGCWGVMQLDDNIDRLAFHRSGKASAGVLKSMGGLAGFADLLAGVSLSTNGRMVGAVVDMMNIGTKIKVARPGFPYSLWIERVGPNREPWYGPFYDDVMHNLQYGTRADGACTVVMPLLRFMKTQPKTGTLGGLGGLRMAPDEIRDPGSLQRLFPGYVRKVKKGDTVRFVPSGIPNKLRVTDPEMFKAVTARCSALVSEWSDLNRQAVRAKIERRMARCS